MKRCVWLFCGVLLALSDNDSASGVVRVERAEDVRIIEVDGEGARYWSRWRGPSGQGLVAQGQYVDKWTPKANVWNVSVPGSGNSSPIVWADRIFLTTGYGNGERLSMLAYSRSDGKNLWETFIPQNGGWYQSAEH